MSAEVVTPEVDEHTQDAVRELVEMVEDLSDRVDEQDEKIDEATERISELEKGSRAQDAKLDAYRKKMNRIVDVMIGHDREFAEVDIEQDDDFWTRIDEAVEIAEDALAVTKSGATRETTTSKKEIAKTLSRNETVVSSIRTSQKAASISCNEVIDMAKPDTRLAHRTILDAWDELAGEEPCFEVLKIDGKKHLRCYTDRLDTVLVRAVEESLSDPEVTESLNSWRSTEKGSEA